MAMRAFDVPLEGSGRSYVGKLEVDGGTLTVRLKSLANGKLRFSAVGKRIDLSSIDTQNRDLTVALEIGDTAFVKNRNLRGARRVFRLPSRKRT
jgi:hypothetical protein